ncbi:hypothetical protein AB6A40_006188 [Gnathostoma spinigerum]|uniref:Uncharacterized protein n=1 Tax=Gnathostoma spinigerum TaxID=75299 RepID=A0ABD6EMV0_9BILA
MDDSWIFESLESPSTSLNSVQNLLNQSHGVIKQINEAIDNTCYGYIGHFLKTAAVQTDSKGQDTKENAEYRKEFNEQKEKHAQDMYRLLVTARSQINSVKEENSQLSLRLQADSPNECPACHHVFKTKHSPLQPSYVRVYKGRNVLELEFSDFDRLKKWLVLNDLHTSPEGLSTIPLSQPTKLTTLTSLGSKLVKGLPEDLNGRLVCSRRQLDSAGLSFSPHLSSISSDRMKDDKTSVTGSSSRCFMNELEKENVDGGSVSIANVAKQNRVQQRVDLAMKGRTPSCLASLENISALNVPNLPLKLARTISDSSSTNIAQNLPKSEPSLRVPNHLSTSPRNHKAKTASRTSKSDSKNGRKLILHERKTNVDCIGDTEKPPRPIEHRTDYHRSKTSYEHREHSRSSSSARSKDRLG